MSIMTDALISMSAAHKDIQIKIAVVVEERPTVTILTVWFFMAVRFLAGQR